MALENTGNEWKNEAPRLSSMENKTPFTVPEGYFNELEKTIKSRCLIEDERFTEEEEFTVPEGYFESLSSAIESRIAEENIREMIPADGFTVPQDYFKGLKQRILAGTTANENVPERSIIRPIRSNWIRYAAAACVTVILGSVLVFNNSDDSIDTQLGEIPDQEIINYLQIYSDMGDTPMIIEGLSQSVSLKNIGNNISDADIEDYINTTL